jgi:phosphoenolpyruvate carboxylase
MSEVEKDALLGQEIQYLGRLLGEAIRNANGTETFDRVEHIRQLAVALRRGPAEDEATRLRDRLAAGLDGLSTEHAERGARVQPFFRCWPILPKTATRTAGAAPTAAPAPPSGSILHALGRLGQTYICRRHHALARIGARQRS